MEKTDWIGIAKILEQIGSVGSTNQKKAILGDHLDNEDLLIILKLAYNPYWKYNITRVDEDNTERYLDENDELIALFLDDLIDLLERLEDRTLSGNEALGGVSLFYYTLPVEFRLYFLGILNKDLRIGLGIGLINKVIPEHIPQFKLGLCERYKKYKDHHFTGRFYIHEAKKDGVRAMLFHSEQQIKARSGIPYENYPHVLEELKSIPQLEYFVLDGEMKEAAFNNTMNNARRVHGDTTNNAIYSVWDILHEGEFYNEDCKVPLVDRKLKLVNALYTELPMDPREGYTEYAGNMGADIKTFLFLDEDEEIIETYWVKKPGLDHIEVLEWEISEGGPADHRAKIIEMFDKYYAEGEEGVIFKDFYSMYIYSSGNSRGKAWGKYKIQDHDSSTASEFTVRITGAYKGTAGKKYEHVLGGFTYESDTEMDSPENLFDGVDVVIQGNCGGGYSNKQRSDFWGDREKYIGKLMDVTSQEITENKNGTFSLRFPVFDRFRDDLE